MYPIKYVENNLVFNQEGECFAYYELVPYNYSFLSPEQKYQVSKGLSEKDALYLAHLYGSNVPTVFEMIDDAKVNSWFNLNRNCLFKLCDGRRNGFNTRRLFIATDQPLIIYA
ncbi:ATP/GTP-binding protein [Enterococcus faecalis]|nr:ATP/GTP-binding protein [Enterococcus faecalis]